MLCEGNKDIDSPFLAHPKLFQSLALAMSSCHGAFAQAALPSEAPVSRGGEKLFIFQILEQAAAAWKPSLIC
jgi:hypothetical protein